MTIDVEFEKNITIASEEKIVLCGLFRNNKFIFQREPSMKRFFTAALALRSRGLVIGSREKEEREREEEKNLQIAIRCLWDLFD